MSLSIQSVQTRIPRFLWDALQDVFYEQDVAFLKTMAPHIGVSLAELRRTLLGTRGQATHIHVGNTDSWWETELCPLRCRDAQGIWRPCGRYREGHGFCREHREFWEPTPTLKHRDDPWFQQVAHRTPWRYNGEIIWVSTAGDAIRENGTPITGISIKGGVLSTIEDTS